MEIVSIPSFLNYYDSARQRTLRVIRHIPPERLEWRYAAGKFSFGDLIRHLAAIERYMWAENVQGLPSRYPGHGTDLAEGFDAVLAMHERLGAESRAIYASLSDADLQRRCETPGGAAMPVWKWLRAMFEHEAHHRGQLHLMLGLVGATAPPLFGLTSEQVRERSEPREE